MSATHLAVVPSAPIPASADTVAQRIRELRNEARLLAHEQVERLQQSLLDAARLAGEITEGGDAYAVGIREFSRHLAEDAERQAAMLGAIVERQRH